jgi:orotate phosphoribosyltransferase
MILIKTAEKTAEFLLQINAIKLNPRNFSWASGWKSPIYCDNRLTPTAVRNYVRDEFSKNIENNLVNQMPALLQEQ